MIFKNWTGSASTEIMNTGVKLLLAAVFTLVSTTLMMLFFYGIFELWDWIRIEAKAHLGWKEWWVPSIFLIPFIFPLHLLKIYRILSHWPLNIHP